MEIRQATAADARTILDLQKVCYRSEAELYNDFSIPPLMQTVEELTEEICRNLVLKAIERDAIIGSVRACAEGASSSTG